MVLISECPTEKRKTFARQERTRDVDGDGLLCNCGSCQQGPREEQLGVNQALAC